nr:asparagine synthase-related protein [uncultured Draconibacterium sp.]
MLKASDYWKPDASSQAISPKKNCHLGKANLFNTVYSKKDFVFTDSVTGSIISANARIDNREDLIKQLNIDNEGISDGELILRAYQKWGKASPKYLLGDFAFIIWDETNQKVFCARDHFGVKLLMYSKTDKGVMITNEPNAFFTSQWLKKELKESWLVAKIWGLASSNNEAAYKGLKMVPAAHYIEIKEGKITIEPYWQLADDTQWKGLSDEALLAELKNRLRHAVAVRLESDYPLACELSEGLDSNAIAGFAAQMKPKEDIYTLSYECVALNDDTRSVWEKTYQDIFEMLDLHNNLKPVWTEKKPSKQDNAVLVKNIAGTFAVRGGWLWHCNLAHQKNSRVLLSGWGGDHCVSTYGDFYESELFSALKWRKVHRLFKDKHRRGRGGNPYKTWIHLLMKHLAPQLAWWYARKHGGLEHALWQQSQYSLLKEDYIKHYRLIPQLKAFTNGYHHYYSTKAHHRRELFDIGVEQRIVDSELSARMFRVEFRYPMLDVPLVEFAYNLPSHLKIYQGIERYAFRKILNGVTTERIQWRIKADVNHPDKELFLLSEQEKQELRNLLNKPLLQKYCHAKTLDLQNFEAKFVVNQFRSFSPVFHYFADNNIPVKDM